MSRNRNERPLLYCEWMRSRHLPILAGVVLLVGACAAEKELKRPEPGTLQLGKTTEAEIRSRFGEPRGVATRLIHDWPVKTYSYSHADSPVDVQTVPVRVVVFMFSNDVLVGYHYLSSFTADATDFDETRVSRIQRGRTTAKQVVELMGTPGGEYIHPLARVQSGRAYVYGYSRTENVPGGKVTTKTKTLVVNFDPNGVVFDVDLSMTGR
jgi:SmpA / OmlA family